MKKKQVSYSEIKSLTETNLRRISEAREKRKEKNLVQKIIILSKLSRFLKRQIPSFMELIWKLGAKGIDV